MNPVPDEQLLSALFHDLRDPLAAVLMQSRSLLKEELTERPRRRTEAIVRSADRAVCLLGDVQDLFRLRQGRLSPTLGDHPLSALADGVTAASRDALGIRNVQLARELDASARGRFDLTLTTRALFHLVVMAAAASPSGATVRLTLGVSEGRARGRVQGESGTPLEDAQASARRSELLGWTVASGLIEAQGGTLVRSDASLCVFELAP